jgi:peptidoglycan hydrolase-like protein with peptidoglycan-binding domain
MTTKQKQCLLFYLGYYDGKIDGDFGPASKGATMGFQEDYGLEPDGIFGEKTEEVILKAIIGEAKPVEKVEIGWDGIKHFKKDEFRCKCGGKHCNGFPVEPDMKLIRIADEVREHFGKPITVSSGVRCETHNAKVGGVSNSRHKYGKAMDFCVSGIPSSIVLPYVQQKAGINYAYAIDGSYVHMDVK